MGVPETENGPVLHCCPMTPAQPPLQSTQPRACCCKNGSVHLQAALTRSIWGRASCAGRAASRPAGR